MAIKKTVYPHSADHARENDELPAYRKSNKLNRECAAAIDKAISDSNYEPFHYDLKSAMQKATKMYGEKRVAWVLAAVIQAQHYDGRYSRQNQEWARSFPLPYEQHYGNSQPRPPYYGGNAHPTLLDGFITYLRNYIDRVPHEAKRIAAELDKIDTPNSPSKTHFMVKVEADFLHDAASADTGKLLRAIQYKSAYLSNTHGEHGIFLFIKQDEVMRKRKPSITGQIKKDAARIAAEKPAKSAAQKKTNNMEVD